MAHSTPWSDAWLLLCVWRTDRGAGAELAEVIGYGDYVNHAILMPGEINGGLDRLGARGLVDVSAGRLHVTVNGRSFCARHERGSEFTCIERLHEALSRLTAASEVEAAGAPAFRGEEFHEAVRSYKRAFRAAMSRLGK